MGVAEYPRCSGRTGRREQHPATLGPVRIVDGLVGAVGRIGQRILDHFLLVDDRPFAEIVNGSDIARREPEPVEATAVEIAVLVKKGAERGALVVLDCDNFITRGGIDRARPIILRNRPLEALAMAGQSIEPYVTCRVLAVLGNDSGPVSGSL